MNSRERMAMIFAGQDPHHPADKPPAPWHSIAMNCILDEMMEPSKGMLKIHSQEGFWWRWQDIIQHIRDGGK